MHGYHHIGIPTERPRAGEKYHRELKFYSSGLDSSAYGIEWMRFDADCDIPELVRTTPHVAFEVDNLEAELEGKEVIIAPNSPSEGVRVAFIVENDAPIEFLQIARPEDEPDD